PVGLGSVRVYQHRDRGRPRHKLAQKLQPLRSNAPERKLTPVVLPPGRLRLGTSPSITGSLPVTNTIGPVVVTALATSADGCFRRSRRPAGEPNQRPGQAIGQLDFPPSDIRSRRSGPR